MSEEVELKLKRRVQIIVIAAMSLFFVLVTVVVFQFAIMIYDQSRIRSLEAHNRRLIEQRDRAEAEYKYFSDPEFQYDFALRFLNRGRPGDIIIV